MLLENSKPDLVPYINYFVKNMINISAGSRLIFLYVLYAYIVPACVIFYLGYPWIYREFDLNYVALIILFLIFTVYWIVGNFRNKKIIPKKIRKSENLLFLLNKKKFLISLLFGSVLIAAFGAVFQLNGFRYLATGISESPSFFLTILLALVASLLQFFLMVYVFYSTTGGEALERGLLALGLLLSSNGIATLLVAMLGVIHLFFPKTLRKILFIDVVSFKTLNQYRYQKIITSLFFLPMSVVLAAFAWIAGEAIKRGELSSVMDLVLSDELVSFAQDWIVLRVSPSYVSLLAALDEYALNTQWEVVQDHFFAPISTFLFRFNALAYNIFDYPRPLDGTIARINYLLITSPEFVSDREGTSPGLIASFLYCFPFPLNFMALISYLLFLQNLFSRMIGGINREMSFIGWTIFLVFMLPMLSSPFDLLLIIDDGAFSALLIFIFSFSFLQRKLL
jgi:hypothetical protein